MKALSLFFILLTPLFANAETWDQLFNKISSKQLAGGSCAMNAETPSDPVDLCNHPAETICNQMEESTSEAVAADMRKALAGSTEHDHFDEQYKTVLTKNTIADGSSSNPTLSLQAQKSLNLAQKEQFILIAKLEKNILTKFNQTPEKLSTFFESIKTSVAEKVSNSPEFAKTSGAEGIVPSKADILKKLKSVKVQTAQTFVDAPTPVSLADYKARTTDANAFLESCGSDGLLVNAYYDPSSNTLKVCPGLLLQNFNDLGGKLGPLAFALGHELGHSFDTEAEVPIQNQSQLIQQFPDARIHKTTTACYDNFLDCIQTNYVAQNQENFGTYTKIIKQLRDVGLPALNAELTRLEAQTPADLEEIARVKRSLQRNEDNLKNYQDMKRYLISKGLNPESVIQNEKNEMTADFMGTQALKNQLKSLPLADRMQTAINAFRFGCDGPKKQRITQMVWGNENDPVHPPDRFRIEMFMRNPEVRGLLQCTPLETPRPWCDLKGL